MAPPHLRSLLLRSLAKATSAQQSERAGAVSLALGDLDAKDGDLNAALQRFRAALAHFQAADSRDGSLEANLRCAEIAIASDLHEEAVSYLEAATADPDALSSRLQRAGADVLANLAIARQKLQRHEDAIDAFKDALARLPQTDAQGVRAQCLLGLGQSRLELGRFSDAAEALTEALDTLDQERFADLALVAREALGVSLAAIGRNREASPVLERVLAQLEDRDDHIGRLRVLPLLAEVEARVGVETAERWSDFIDAAQTLGHDRALLHGLAQRAERIETVDDLLHAAEVASRLNEPQLAAAFRSRAAYLLARDATASQPVDLELLARATELYTRAGDSEGLRWSRATTHIDAALRNDHEALADAQDVDEDDLALALHRVYALAAHGKLDQARALARRVAPRLEDPDLQLALDLLTGPQPG